MLLQLRINRQRSSLSKARVSFSLIRSWQHLRFAALAGITLGWRNHPPWLIPSWMDKWDSSGLSSVSVPWCYSSTLGTKEEVWGHKDSVLCLQITTPALGLVMRALTAAFYLSSPMALGLQHSVTLSFGVSSSSSSYCVFLERKHYGCQYIKTINILQERGGGQVGVDSIPWAASKPQGKGESREILRELQGVPAEVVLGRGSPAWGCSRALPPLKDRCLELVYTKVCGTVGQTDLVAKLRN